MSVKVMSWVWDNATVEGTALLMLLAIADHANDDGVCWPSVARLAQRARVHQRQAQYIIGQLEEAGFIIIKRGTGRGRTSVYTINGLKDADDCTHMPAERAHTTAPIAPIKGAVQRERVQSSAIKGAVRSHAHGEPSVEPSLNTTVTARGANLRTPTQQKSPPAPAVTIWRELTGLQPNQSQATLITQAVTDCDLWRTRLTEWLADGYKPGSVRNQLDVYANGWQRKGPGTNSHAPPQPEPKTTRRMTQPIFAKEQP